MTELPPLVLAHGGEGAGWDELLVFAVPALIFVVYLAGRWRERRRETRARRPDR